MRPVLALLPAAALMLALGGCDKRSGNEAQGTGNTVTSGEVTSGEVTSGEAPSSGSASTGASSGEGTFKHTVDRSHKGETMPTENFTGPDGKRTTLAEEAGGKPFMVNLWATWCAPCIAELPALDKFAGDIAGKGVKVIAVSQDSEGAKQVDSFLASHKLANLKRYLDPETALGFAYGTSLPTTVLYDKQGKEVARVVGALEWEGPEAQALIKEIAG